MEGEEQLVVVQEVASRKADEWKQARDQIVQNLAQSHELIAHAIVFVRKGTIPRTSSNKVQRQACKAAFLNKQLHVLKEWRTQSIQSRKPRTPAPRERESAKDVAAKWLAAEIARRRNTKPTKADVHRPITQFGMDSLTAIELAHKLQTTFSLEVRMSDLFNDVTIAELIRRAKPVPAVDETNTAALPASLSFPLSHGQQALWLVQQMAPESTAYNIARAVRIRSAIDVEALRRSFQALVDLHPSLRVVFPVIEEQVVQQERRFARDGGVDGIPEGKREPGSAAGVHAGCSVQRADCAGGCYFGSPDAEGRLEEVASAISFPQLLSRPLPS